MATQLFKVKVLSKCDNVVILQLRIISAEQPDFCKSKSFALMVICDPIINEVVENAPLAQRVSFEHTLDITWVSKNVHNYIEDCHLYDIKNYPITVDLENLSPKQRRDFWKSAEVPQAVFEITVTNPLWIEHIHKGMEWQTAAFDLMDYD
jgi:hypothetical protein